MHFPYHVYQPGKLRDEENKKCHAMLHWLFPLNMECHQSQLQWIQKRKFGQLLFLLQPCSFVPTKNTTSDTTRAVYLNSSESERGLSLRKQDYHRRGCLERFFFFLCLSALAVFLCALQNKHCCNQFLSYHRPWYSALLHSALLSLYSFCQAVTTFSESTSMTLSSLKICEYFEQNCWSISKAEAVVWDFAHNILAWATLNHMLWSTDLICVTVVAFVFKD